MQTLAQKFSDLRDLGFRTPEEFTYRGGDKARLEQEYNRIRSNRVNGEIPFDIDGLVISVDDQGKADALGFTTDAKNAPRAMVALKFPSAEAVSTIRDIEWSVGRNHITPVAIIDPVEMVGAMISRVSLKSHQYVVENGIGIGSSVTLIRAGDIIPKVEDFRNYGTHEQKIPHVCPCCGSPTRVNGAYIECTAEVTECSGKSGALVENFLKGMKVKGLGRSTLVKYHEAGIQLQDFFEDDFSTIRAKVAAAGESLVVFAKVEKQLQAIRDAAKAGQSV